MGLKEFWSRLTGGDTVERVEEEMEADGSEQPEPVEDYEARKDDVALDERFRGTDFDADRDD
ncbi:MAG TPA: hypothetical protein VFT86_00245 [Gaiellaceae bacterium]|nr:hypothetical protein [Gaiellaceae bacterium]